MTVKQLTAYPIPYPATGKFSPLINAYLTGDKRLENFIAFPPNESGLKEAIKKRQTFTLDRSLLRTVIEAQYQKLERPALLNRNIALLEAENTFTICTAHQPNLMGGYLYFLYKIAHTIALANTLKDRHPGLNFVPVYYMGSEDNDLDELSVFRFERKTYRWMTAQTGAVGRMKTDDLSPLLEQLCAELIPENENRESLETTLQKAYNSGLTMADATRILVNELFGADGLVVLDPDHPELKRRFLPIMEKELTQPVSRQLVEQTNDLLGAHFPPQAFARDINLFYLRDNIRERIEYKDGEWVVAHTRIHWHRDALLEELRQHPERFSPNVILRGLYQETLLPNVAFIGGGSEVAYWMQLKTLFEHYQVFFPPLILRQSFLLMNDTDVRWQHKLRLQDQDLFKSPRQLLDAYIRDNSPNPLTLDAEKAALKQILDELKDRALAVDSTLGAASEAVAVKISKQLKRLSEKIHRAERRKHREKAEQYDRFLETLFPGGNLQERTDSFLEYYLLYGPALTRTLIEHSRPYGDQFVILKQDNPSRHRSVKDGAATKDSRP